MVKEYKSLFNRTYLKYIVFIIAIAVIVLSPKKIAPLEQPVNVKEGKGSLLFLADSNIEESLLLLSFQSIPALTLDDKVTREFEYAALRKSVGRVPELVSALWTADRLELSLHWSEQQPRSLAEILRHISSTVLKAESSQQRKLISAKHYLANNTNSGFLFNTLDQRLSALYPGKTTLAKALSTPPSALLIADADIDDSYIIDLEQQLANHYSNVRLNLPAPRSWRASTQHIAREDKGYNLLIATELAKSSNHQNILDLISYFTLQQRLELLNQQSALKYRVVRRPLFQYGYQALHLFSDTPIQGPRLNNIKQFLLSSVEEESLDLTKQQLLNEYENLLNDSNRRYKLYSKKAFYQLAVLSSSEYQALLESIDTQAITSQIEHSLDTGNAFVISMQPE